MQKRGRDLWVLWLILAVLAASIWAASLHMPRKDSTLVPLTQVARLVKAGEVKGLVIDAAVVQVEKTSGEQLTARKDPNTSLITSLRILGVTPAQLRQVNLVIQPPGRFTGGWHWLIVLLPLVLVALWFSVVARPAGTGQGGRLDALLGSPAQRYHRTLGSGVTFDDVAGEDEAKQELEEVVAFLRSPGRFGRLGAHVPHGILLVGPPGCGKTLLARAVAGEAGVPFFSVSASEFVEIFAGVGASRVRSLFDTARKLAPCIVFVDELDAVGRRRATGAGRANQEWEQTLNQLLVEMDGFDNDTHVIILAATNRSDILDPALLRPGRFDRRVVVDLPDRVGREAILTVCVRGKPLAPDVDLEVIARQTLEFSGAELENAVNEAAILAARLNRQAIGMTELQEAVEKVRAGPVRKSRTLDPAEREVVAYHEAGHALARTLLPGCDPVCKVTTLPRGTHLGYTLSLPETDRRLYTCAKLNDELAALLAGRAAEELIIGDVSTHAADDLRQATALARRMVTRFGMSETLGPLTYGRRHQLASPGNEIGRQRGYSEATAQAIDAEVAHLVTQAHQRARTLLTGHQPVLVRLALKLLEDETVEGEELAGLVAEMGEVNHGSEDQGHRG